ncbi:kinase-like domain-containing protein [Rhodofomes roseus]|uniref:Kinase-like domain-containing protein n=1 Tax=Rhodofomes roseus TaxID=34475 RepID=A0ABQ8KRF6_9APHY|nr:kinase-like domain-containing protein [Rhodofomes roseus]KAH9841368.1 kinase-like domain-containing protein [Rhodofomes roseus]
MSDEAIRYPRYIANWWLGDKLGEGFSGAIFRATHLHTRQQVAVKLQPSDIDCPTNSYERNFYPALQGGTGMPTLWASGVERGFDFLAIDLLGPSLDSLFRRSGKNVMDLRSVCCIAMQVIERLDFMHSRGVLHRDIQLGNCVVGLPPHDQLIYMIDFGFSKFYIDRRTGRHIPDSKQKRDFIGNYWFSSVGVHCRGKVPSRRDDMEAAALMLIHLLTPGGLSWTRNGVPKTDAAHERLKREKRDARPEDLCRGLPAEFEEFLRYCRRLKFMDCPDYAYWLNEFRELAKESGFPENSLFVWPPPEPVRSIHVIPPRQPGGVSPRTVDGILHDLANMHLGSRQVLGERNTNANKPRKDENDAGRGPANAIVISSANENPRKPQSVVRMTKATHLTKLARAVSDARDNENLSRVVQEFVELLQASRSRTLTKEGFTVLDALYKQLADPSVYIMPLRTSRTSDKEQAAGSEPRYVKMNKLFQLRTGVVSAQNNRALAQLVAEFGAVINKSNGRTITKDAFGFLENLAARLQQLA